MILAIISILIVLGQDFSTAILYYYLFVMHRCNKNRKVSVNNLEKAKRIAQTNSLKKLFFPLCFFHLLWVIMAFVLYYLLHNPSYIEANANGLVIMAFALNANGLWMIVISALGYITLKFHLAKFNNIHRPE